MSAPEGAQDRGLVSSAAGLLDRLDGNRDGKIFGIKLPGQNQNPSGAEKKKVSPFKKSSPGRKSPGRKSPASPAAEKAPQKMPDWWVRCKKCGHVPRGTPQMACSSCKEVHGNWTPDPMQHVVKIANETRSVEAECKKSRVNIANLRTSNAALKDEVRQLESRLQADEAEAEHAALEIEALEIEKMGKGPQTKARQQTLVSNANRRMILLKTRVEETEEEVRDLNGQTREVERSIGELRLREAALQREREALAADNSRMQQAVLSAARRYDAFFFSSFYLLVPLSLFASSHFFFEMVLFPCDSCFRCTVFHGALFF
eukprot:114495_1